MDSWALDDIDGRFLGDVGGRSLGDIGELLLCSVEIFNFTRSSGCLASGAGGPFCRKLLTDAVGLLGGDGRNLLAGLPTLAETCSFARCIDVRTY
jgi:hypothetical protein